MRLRRALVRKREKVERSGNLMEVRIGHGTPETAGQLTPSFDSRRNLTLSF